MLLTLGYTQGVQVWMIPYNGEAQEVFSLKHGQIKSLRLLPTPENVFGTPDNFAHCRPLAVTVDSAGPGPAFSAASFTSLKTGDVKKPPCFRQSKQEIYFWSPFEIKDIRQFFRPRLYLGKKNDFPIILHENIVQN